MELDEPREPVPYFWVGVCMFQPCFQLVGHLVQKSGSVLVGAEVEVVCRLSMSTVGEFVVAFLDPV